MNLQQGRWTLDKTASKHFTDAAFSGDGDRSFKVGTTWDCIARPSKWWWTVSRQDVAWTPANALFWWHEPLSRRMAAVTTTHHPTILSWSSSRGDSSRLTNATYGYGTIREETAPARGSKYMWNRNFLRRAKHRNTMTPGWQWCHRNKGISMNRGAQCCSFESRVLRERNYSFETKKVDWHSCQQMLTRRCSFNRNLKKLVMRLGRHKDQDEYEVDGAVHWDSMGPKLWKVFQKAGGRKFSDTHWLQRIYHGSSKMKLLYIRAIKRHASGKLIARECLGTLLFHTIGTNSFSERMFLHLYFNSQVRTRGWWKCEQRWKTQFSFPMFENDQEGEWPSDDFTKPSQEHYRRKWRPHDAVYWVNQAKAQDEG